MAYNNQGAGTKSYGAKKPPVAAPAAGKTGFGGTGGGDAVSKPTIFSTGLFKPKFEDAKQLADVLIKETVTLPAGSRMKLYEVEVDKQGEHGKLFSISVK